MTETLKVITEGLKNRKTECAFLILTCEGSIVKTTYNKNYNGISAGPGVGWEQAWIEAVQAKLKEYESIYPIYDKPITAETTLGDVAGKIIIKVNTNDQNQEQYIAADATIPALFSIWENPKDHKPDYVSTVDLRWGTPNSKSQQTPMNWMSAEVTNVGIEIDKAGKETSIRNMFKNAVDIYNDPESKHNTYFMVDLGGCYTDGNDTQTLAKDMNQLAVDALQTRKENASTGLVFMNFADRDTDSGANYKSDYIIATIIDNNFKFALRKKQAVAAATN
ncbi:hypothetical protein [uncultured Bacteroides sp.]|uniref:hypothetical protein n=1 Tax=uncultured Bacteroides sp. TaxID=162156 RepID=UPI0025D9EC3D|nr:hypothetical protein [uncultured Bacteroides sp.]